MKTQFTSEQERYVAQQQVAFQLSKHVYGSVSKVIQLTKTEDAQAVGLTKKALGELAYQMHEKRAKRMSNRPLTAQQLATGLREGLRASISKRLTAQLLAGFTYRQPQSDWVDVNNTISAALHTQSTFVKKSDGTREELPRISNFNVLTQTVWHPKHSWRANQTSHKLYLLPSDTFTTIGGLLTIYKKADAHLAEIPCRWYEQSRGFEVREVHGWLIDGLYHSEDKSKRSTAKKNVALLRNARFDEAQFTAKAVHQAFGFCMAGIRQFCEANGLNPAGNYSGKELRAVVVKNRELNCRMYAHYLKKMGLKLNCK